MKRLGLVTTELIRSRLIRSLVTIYEIRHFGIFLDSFFSPFSLAY